MAAPFSDCSTAGSTSTNWLSQAVTLTTSAPHTAATISLPLSPHMTSPPMSSVSGLYASDPGIGWTDLPGTSVTLGMVGSHSSVGFLSNSQGNSAKMSTQQASSDPDLPRMMMERYLDDMGPLSSSSDVMQGGVSQSMTDVAELRQRQVSMPLGQLCSSSPLSVFDKSQQGGMLWDVQLSEQEGLTTASDQVEPSVGVIMPVGDLGHNTLSTNGSLRSGEPPSVWERRAVNSLAQSHLKQLSPLAVAAAVGAIPNYQDMTPGGLAAKLEELSSSHGVVLSPGGSSIGSGKRSPCVQSGDLGRVHTPGELQLHSLKKFRSGDYSIPSPEMVSLSCSPRHAPSSLMRTGSVCDLKPFTPVGTTFCTTSAMLDRSTSQSDVKRPQSARSLTMSPHMEAASPSPHTRMHDMSRPSPLLVPHNYLSPRQAPGVTPLGDDALGFDGHASEIGGLGRTASVPGIDKGEWWAEWGEDWRPDSNAGRLLQMRKEMNAVSNSWASEDDMAGTPAATPRLTPGLRNAISDPGRGLSGEARSGGSLVGLTSEDADTPRGEQKSESGSLQEKKPYKRGACMEPQAIAARDRRGKIAQRLKALQQLVCPSGKGGTDTVTMLEEAIGYVKRLQEQIKDLTSQEDKDEHEEKPKERVTASERERSGGATSPNGSSMKS